MILSAIAFVSAAIVLVTIIARGADHPVKPSEAGWLPMLRLQAEKMALLLVGVAAGWMMLSILVGMHPPGEAVALLAGSALWAVSHPAGWIAYVTQGRLAEGHRMRP